MIDGILSESFPPDLLYHPDGGALAFRWERDTESIEIWGWNSLNESLQYPLGIDLSTTRDEDDPIPFEWEQFVMYCNRFLGDPAIFVHLEKVARAVHRASGDSTPWNELTEEDRDRYTEMADAAGRSLENQTRAQLGLEELEVDSEHG